MAISKRENYVMMLVLGFLFVANIFDPGGTFGIKYVATLLVCLICACTVRYADLTAGEMAVG